MEKFLESLTFFFGSSGACLLIMTCFFCISKIINYFDKLNEDSTKNIIKSTLKEIDKKSTDTHGDN